MQAQEITTTPHHTQQTQHHHMQHITRNHTVTNRVKALPEGLLDRCTSLGALLLRSNPVTVEALRAAPGFEAYDARRRARTDKQLGGRVMSDLERGFCQGADVSVWEHHKPGGR